MLTERFYVYTSWLRFRLELPPWIARAPAAASTSAMKHSTMSLDSAGVEIGMAAH